MRARNRALLLDVVRRFGPLSRVELHKLTHIRPASISQITRELIDERLLREAGPSDNPTGRKQILLEMNKNAGIILAVDFDAEQVAVARLDCRPALVGEVYREPTDLRGKAELLDQLLRCARRGLEGTGGERIVGVGVGDPGIVDTARGLSVAASTIDFWRDVPLRDRFETELGIPCVVADNTRARTVAERTLGAGGGSDDMIFIEYGLGIGAGMFTGGKVLLGHAYVAGEFGHTHVSEGGPPCKCGSFGCLEAVASIGALESTLRRAIREGGSSRCLDMAGGDVERITGWHVLEAARLGDKMSVTLVEEMARRLGLGIANMVNLFNPELIVLDRRLALAGDVVLNEIVRVVRREALAYSSASLQFRFGDLGVEASLLGLGLLVLDSVFEVPDLKAPRLLMDRSLKDRLRSGRSHAEPAAAAGAKP